MTKTVKLVNDHSNSRTELFSKIITDLDGYTQVGRVSEQPNSEANFNIVFSFKDLDTLRKLKIPKNPGYNNKFLLFDLTEDLFDNKKWGPIITLLTVCSNYVTCSNEILQERIYEVTGRLSTIIKTPIDESKVIKPTINNTNNLLWYGSITDVFSVYKHKNKENLTIALTNGRISSTNSVSINTTKKRDKVLKNFDVVFLPETSTLDGEIRRLEKIKECTLLGKAVIQDETMKIPSKKELKEMMEEAQQVLLEEEGYLASISQLEWALNHAPKDDYLEYVSAI